jgi:hypothetical protein
MANWVISLLVAASGVVWIYNKFLKTTGNNTKSSLIASVISFGVLFIIMMIVMSFIGGAIS